MAGLGGGGENKLKNLGLSLACDSATWVLPTGHHGFEVVAIYQKCGLPAQRNS